MIKNKKLIFFSIMGIIFLIAIIYLLSPSPGPIMVLSTSSDGNYVISTDAKKNAILWNLEKKDTKVLSHNANVYSAYFIKNTNDFMWQDLHDIVHVQNINGNEILKFHNFPTYGEVLTSDLKHFFACNENLDLYENYGNNQKLVLSNGNQGGFFGAQKLLNLTLSNDNNFLLTSGIGGNYQPFQFDDDDGITLWNVNTNKPIQKFSGITSLTFATLSPDDKYIVDGAVGGSGSVWNLPSGKKQFDLDDIYSGHPIDTTATIWKWDNKRLIPTPKDFMNVETGYDSNADILTLKFIDANGHYLRFTTYVPYAILYSVNNPQPIKYFQLIKNPLPSINDFSRDQSIDTAPTANILVIGEQYGNGIIVYKFDPKTLTLNKIWVSNV